MSTWLHEKEGAVRLDTDTQLSQLFINSTFLDVERYTGSAYDDDDKDDDDNDGNDDNDDDDRSRDIKWSKSNA